MFLVIITLALIALGVAAFLWGAVALSRFGFRVSVPVGLAVLLFPPYTFYFAFFRLEEEGQELPTASWMGGLIVSVLLALLFSPTLGHVVNGNWDQIRTAEGPGEVASSSESEDDSEEGASEDSSDQDDSASSDSDGENGDSGDQSDNDETESAESGDETDGESASEEDGESAGNDNADGESDGEGEQTSDDG